MNVKSLLVIILALSIAVPTITLPMATTVTHAASSPALPSVSVNAQVFEPSATAEPNYSISNPVSGSSVKSISIYVPTSLASGAPTKIKVSGVPPKTYTTTVYGTGPWSVVVSSNSSSDILIPAGATIAISFEFPTISAAKLPSAGTVGAVTAVSAKYTSGSHYGLVSPELYVTAALGYIIKAPTSITAGTNGVFKIEAIAPSGVTVSWVPAFLYVNVPSSAPSSAMVTYPEVINASSTAPTKFNVNATYASSMYNITASGSSSNTSVVPGEIKPSLAPFTVQPGTPTQVTVALSTDQPGYTTDYATGPVNVTGISLTDAYGNTVNITKGTVITLSTSAGTLNNSFNNYDKLSWLSPSKLPYGTELSTTVTKNITTVVGPLLYVPVPYGSSSQVSASVKIPSNVSYAGTYSGTSNVVITSTLSGVKYVATTSPSSPKAGQTIYATVYLDYTTLVSGTQKNVGQPNVPVNFYVSTSKSTYTAPNHATPASGVEYTNSSGYAVFSFTETSTSESVYVWTSIPQPVTGNSSAMLSNVSTTTAIKVSPGAPSALKIITSPSKYLPINGTASVNVELTDAYGNLVPAPSTSLQITLSVSAGSLSANTVYITSGQNSTEGSGYSVEYYGPSTTGAVTITAKAVQPSISSATKTLQVISKYPMLGVTSPANGKVLTTQNITVNAWAAPSPAAPSGTYITKFMYSLNGANNKSVAITSTNSSGYDFYSFPVTLASGLNTIKLYATDSQGLTSEYTVTYTLSTVPPTPAQTIIFPTSAPPMQTKVAGFNVINVTIYNNVSTTLTATPIVVLSNSTFSWVAIGNPTPIAPGQTVVSFVSVQNIPAGTYTAKIFIVTPSGITISGYKTITVTIS